MQNGVQVYFIEEDKISPEGWPLMINKIQRIHIGDSTKDFNFCDKTYKLKSVISNNTNELWMKVSKNSGQGTIKDLDVTISSEYGDNIIRINIDDDADNKSTWFKVPDTP